MVSNGFVSRCFLIYFYWTKSRYAFIFSRMISDELKTALLPWPCNMWQLQARRIIRKRGRFPFRDLSRIPPGFILTRKSGGESPVCSSSSSCPARCAAVEESRCFGAPQAGSADQGRRSRSFPTLSASFPIQALKKGRFYKTVISHCDLESLWDPRCLFFIWIGEQKN